jgi:hypothetical protein
MPTVIKPTHTCFDDVLDHQSYLFKTDPQTVARQHIVHGICLMPEGPRIGEPYAHAWVEDDTEDRVYQSGLVDTAMVWYSVSRPEWYAMMRVQKFTRYTFLEALKKNWQTYFFGPWEPEYLALCGKPQGDARGRTDDGSRDERVRALQGEDCGGGPGSVVHRQERQRNGKHHSDDGA